MIHMPKYYIDRAAKYFKYKLLGDTIVIKVNGRDCDTIEVEWDDSSKDVLTRVLKLENVQITIGKRRCIKNIYVPHKYFNIIVR